MTLQLALQLDVLVVELLGRQVPLTVVSLLKSIEVVSVFGQVDLPPHGRGGVANLREALHWREVRAGRALPLIELVLEDLPHLLLADLVLHTHDLPGIKL